MAGPKRPAEARQEGQEEDRAQARKRARKQAAKELRRGAPRAEPASDAADEPIASSSPLERVIGATGIVYGDIGTSPLYAFETSLKAAGADQRRGGAGRAVADLLGLAISVTLKYVVVMMRADNEGEGGILALLALAQRRLIPAAAVAEDRRSTWRSPAPRCFSAMP